MSIKRIVTGYNWQNWRNSNFSRAGTIEFIIKAIDGTLVATHTEFFTQDNTQYFRRAGIQFSTNNGKTWQKSNITTSEYNYPILADDGTLVIGCSSGTDRTGIKYSEDNGKTWQSSSITAGFGFNYKFGKANDGTLVASCDYSENGNTTGIQFSIDNGKTWQKSNITSGIYPVFVNAANNVLVAGSNNSDGIIYSEDSGKTWQKSNITSSDYKNFILTTNGILVTSSNYVQGIKYSEDSGKTWQSSSASFLATSNDNVTTFVEANDKTLVAANSIRNNIGIIYSEDSGKTWLRSNITTGFRVDKFIKADDGTLVAYSSNDYGIKYSEDSGKTWNDSNITSKRIRALEKALDGTLVASIHESGIIYSEDSGKTWNDSNIISGPWNGGWTLFITANDGTFIACSNNTLSNGSNMSGIIYLTPKVSFSGTEGVTPGFEVAQELVNRIKNLKARITALENK